MHPAGQVQHGSRDEILFGIFLLARHRRALPELDWDLLDRWAESIDNWETCDQLAMNVVAPAAAARSDAVEQLSRWATSPNRWRRRLAAATAAALNHRGRPAAEATLAICRPPARLDAGRPVTEP